MSGLVGWTITRPMVPVSVRPMCVQVLPASVDLYIPVPGRLARKMLSSPVPTYTMFGFDGATATSPIDAVAWCSKIGFQAWPLSEDFQTPPEAEPIYKVRVAPAPVTAIDVMRPV